MAGKPSSANPVRPTDADAPPGARPASERPPTVVVGASAVAGNPAAKTQGQPPAIEGQATGRLQPDNPAGPVQPLHEPDQPDAFRLRVDTVARAAPGWLVSMVVHMVVLLLLALVTLPRAATDDLRQLVVAPRDPEALQKPERFDNPPPEEIDLTGTRLVFEPQGEREQVSLSAADPTEAAPLAVSMSDFSLEHVPDGAFLTSMDTLSGDALSGRGPARELLWRQGGGSGRSEQAVALALQWLAEHQLPDGSWNFVHTLAPRCRPSKRGGLCRNPGIVANAPNAATGLALLPFLGAGHTHKEGDYRQTVHDGLYFLIKQMQLTPRGGSLIDNDGLMYSHGIASIALCEAYAMTRDRKLRDPAQRVIDFICYAQDPIGGGWRYSPQPLEGGDTSVLGWQIMALKSGHFGYLQVPPVIIQKVRRFLDFVQADDGAQYGYRYPEIGRPATTAIGLLSRMYLGWKKDNPALKRGVQWISDRGPSPNNMYYNYYATQVMWHWEGELWKKWNNVMRDQLVDSQAGEGHERGSWFMPHRLPGQEDEDEDQLPHTDRGGRLYCTAMATMILEVYYRHLPIYRKQNIDMDFPLD